MFVVRLVKCLDADESFQCIYTYTSYEHDPVYIRTYVYYVCILYVHVYYTCSLCSAVDLQDLPLATSDAQMLTEAFEVQYRETQQRLQETVNEIIKVTSAWTERDGLYVMYIAHIYTLFMAIVVCVCSDFCTCVYVQYIQ